MAFGYNGFISYSHAADGKLAPTIQRALHSLAKPWYRLRALHVFRDETSLSANPSLWPSIEKALFRSQWFIYLASPPAAESEWVRREISWWLSQRKPSSLLLVLTEGTLSWDRERSDFDWRITNAVPRELSGRFQDEPLWSDLSWAKNIQNINLRHSQFRSAILRIAAPMHGRAPDELDGEDVRQHRRTRRLTIGAVVSLLMLTITAMVTSYFAVKSSRQSVSRELATYAVQQLDTDPELSLRLSLHAVEKAETRQAEEALRTALAESKVRITIPTPGQAICAQFSPDENSIGLASARMAMLIATKTGKVKVLEHPDLVWNIEFSGDGRIVVTGSWDGKARVWDVATGKKLLEIDTPGDKVDLLALNEDASRLLTVSTVEEVMKMACMWDMKTGALVAFLDDHTGAIEAARFDPSGQRIVTGGWDHTVRVWDVLSGLLLKTLEGHGAAVQTVAFSEDGRLIISGGLDLTVRCWDAATGELQAQGGQATEMEGLLEVAERFVVLSPNAERALVYATGKAVVYDTISGEKVRELLDVPSSIPDAVFSNDGQRIAAPSRSGTAFVWDVETGRRIAEFRGHKGDLNGATFSPDGRLLITSGTDNTARIWLIEKSVSEFILKAEVFDAIWSPDGRFVATGSSDASVSVWDAQSGALLSVLSSPGRVSSLTFSEDNKRLLIAKFDAGGAREWDFENSVVIQDYIGRQTENERLEGADWSPDGSIMIADIGGELFRWNAKTGEALPVISPGKDRSILDGLCGYSRRTGLACMKSEDQTLVQVWNVSSGEMVSELKGHVTPASETTMSADGQLLALSDHYGVEIWEVQTGRRKSRLEEDQEYINTLSFSPSGRLIITGGGEPDPVARVWVTNSGRLVTQLRGHKHSIQSARFSPDERLVVTASQDNTARIWSAEDGRAIEIFPGQATMIVEARYSPDGLRVLTASADATARVYDASLAKPLSELLRIAQKRFPRELTPEEVEQYLH